MIRKFLLPVVVAFFSMLVFKSCSTNPSETSSGSDSTSKSVPVDSVKTPDSTKGSSVTPESRKEMMDEKLKSRSMNMPSGGNNDMAKFDSMRNSKTKSKLGH